MEKIAKDRMAQALKSEEHFKDPKNRAELQEGRRQAGMDQKYCF